MEGRTPLSVLRGMDAMDVWLFLVMRSICQANGSIQIKSRVGPVERIARLASGYKDLAGSTVSVNTKTVMTRLKKFAYLKIIQLDNPPNVDENIKVADYATPIYITKEFMDLVPNPKGYISPEVVEDMQEKYRLAEAEIRGLKRGNASLKKEIKVAMAPVKPIFKLENQDGGRNERGHQMRRIWSWFVLLDIHDAFTMLAEGKDGNIEKKIDGKVLGQWMGMYGIDVIESILLTFLMNSRLDSIKEEAGEEWKSSIRRFLVGSFRKETKKKKPSTTRSKTAVAITRDDGND